ncbi:phosphodiester glycosidase family protein [Brachybacterium alimentarium]|uniref:phosphodiester glycosidase family protein n=1 Tax=Brachybacterium alimentarium TaxID=47845 RepID=UPI003FD16E26
MTDIHAFDADGTASPGAQTALNNATEGLATETQIAQAVDDATTGLASEAYVDGAVDAIPDASTNGRGMMTGEDKTELMNAGATARAAERGRPSRTSVSWGVTNGAPYSVVRVFDAMRPGVIAKSLGGAMESTGSTGANLKPTPETLRSFSARTGYAVAANVDGWRTDGNVGEMRGPQIIEGQILHDFGDPDESVHQGIEALGIRADGTYGTYSVRDGDTVQSMVDDGVVTSFSYGPQCVRDGAVRDISDSYWSQFHDTLSARQIIGYTDDGTFLIITVTGVSYASGIAGTDCGPLALSLGAVDAWIMDGGGSAHTAVGNEYAMPSSDAKCERPVPSALLVNATVSAGQMVSPWWPVTIQESSVETHDTAPSYRIAGDAFEFKGGVKMKSGDSIPTSVNYALRFPFKPAWQTAASAISAGIVQGKVSVRADGQVNLYGNNSTVPYLLLDGIRAPFLV